MTHYKDFGFTFNPCRLNNIMVKQVHSHHSFVALEHKDPSVKDHNFSGLSTAQLKKDSPRILRSGTMTKKMTCL